MPYCICKQHFDIPYHGRWHQRGKPTTGTSGPERTALLNQQDTNNKVIRIRVDTTEKMCLLTAHMITQCVKLVEMLIEYIKTKTLYSGFDCYIATVFKSITLYCQEL